MKKIICLAFTSLLIMKSAIAQTAYDVLHKDIPLTYFGIDYTQAKGYLLNAQSSEIVTKYMPSINQVVVKESPKYDIAGTFNKTNLIYDLTDVNRLNATIDTMQFQMSDSKGPNISSETIASMIKQYSLQGKTGVGMVFIAQFLSKPAGKATYHLVFFSLPEGKIILDEVVSGKAQGFGFRNFWANTIYDALKKDTKKVKSKYSK